MLRRLGGTVGPKLRDIVLIVLAAGCVDVSGSLGGADPETLGKRTDHIVNGQLHDGDPATVFMWLGGGSCTGTLVSPKVVLTAKHCLQGVSVSQLQVFFGNDSEGTGTWIQATHKLMHPSEDIGIFTMAEPGPTTPIPMNPHDLTTKVGEEVRIVGFGVTGENASDSGRKRAGVTALYEVDGTIIYTGDVGSMTCYGDSGGPNFMTIDGVEYVAGVTSFGTAACGTGLDGAMNVAAFYDWATAYVDEKDPPSCGLDSRCGTDCPTPDPDCVCAADDVCSPLCPDLASDPDCEGCGSGDVCRNDCPALDVDCCNDDGTCNDACGDTDADCVDEGGMTGGGDGNGADPGDVDPGDGTPDVDEDAEGDVTGGCAVAAGGSQASFGWLALLAAIPLVRRRQR